MSDVMLQAHFKELRQELQKAKANKSPMNLDEKDQLLKRSYNYLKHLSSTSKLDDRGTDLLYQLAQFLDERNLK